MIVASSRGGVYSTSDAGRALEHQESYLQTVFGFFGILLALPASAILLVGLRHLNQAYFTSPFYKQP